MSETAATKTRVAVIGSGLAGLTVAYLLAESGLQVDIFERESKIGFGAQSIMVPIGTDQAESMRIETPMRSFSTGFYKSLLKLFRHLDVPMVQHEFSFSFSGEQCQSPHTVYHGAGGSRGYRSSLSNFGIALGNSAEP